MNQNQEKAVQRLSDEILNALGNLDDYDSSEERRRYFIEAAGDGLKKLTKEEVIDILAFVLVDYELFFDVFEQCIERSKRAPKNPR